MTDEQKEFKPGEAMYNAGMYYFHDAFNNKSTATVVNWIIDQNLQPKNKRKKQLTLIINSPGGSVHAAFALIDTMKGSAIPVHTVGVGLIASCGILTFMAGKKGHRVITPNTSILSHQYSWGSRGKEHELFAQVKEFELSTSRMMEHYKKCTGLTEDKIRESLLPPEDVYLSAKEAKKLNLCDSVKTIY